MMDGDNPPDQKNLVRLIDRLNSYPIGLPDSPEIREFLTIFLDADEIELAANFPMKEITAEELAKKIPHAVSPSPFILNINKENCSGCGACVKMCQIKALSLKDQKTEVDDQNCLGCGSCIKFCKKNALLLMKRKKQPKIPKNMSERFLKIAWEKGRLHKLFPGMLFSKLSKLV